ERGGSIVAVAAFERRPAARIEVVVKAGHRIVDVNHLRRLARGNPLTEGLQALLEPGASFAITIKPRLVLAPNLIALTWRLSRLRDGRGRIRRALHHLIEGIDGA